MVTAGNSMLQPISHRHNCHQTWLELPQDSYRPINVRQFCLRTFARPSSMVSRVLCTPLIAGKIEPSPVNWYDMILTFGPNLVGTSTISLLTHQHQAIWYVDVCMPIFCGLLGASSTAHLPLSRAIIYHNWGTSLPRHTWTNKIIQHDNKMLNKRNSHWGGRGGIVFLWKASIIFHQLQNTTNCHFVGDEHGINDRVIITKQ